VRFAFDAANLFNVNHLPRFDVTFRVGSVGTPYFDPSGLIKVYWRGSVVILGTQYSFVLGCDTTGLEGPLRSLFYLGSVAQDERVGGFPAVASPWLDSFNYTVSTFFGVLADGNFSWKVTTLGE
jgi:hypothetical protein